MADWLAAPMPVHTGPWNPRPPSAPAPQTKFPIFYATAARAESRCRILGGGSKEAFGPPADPEEGTLDLSALAGITLYEPDELVLTARAGTPLSDITNAIAERGQCLAFEPPEFSALLGGGEGHRPTLGGVVACGWSGPRRIKAGAVRDHVLGVLAIGGDGQSFRSGGRVVKNVTGFDLPKLLTGSHGTLAAMTDITIKVLPAPEATRTLVLLELDDDAAVRLLTNALGSPYEIAGAAHLPAAVAARSSVPAIAQSGGSATLIRLEGFGPSVADRYTTLESQFGEGIAYLSLDADECTAVWREIRDVAPLIDPGSIVWRLSLRATDAARVARDIARRDRRRGVLRLGRRPGLWLALPAGAADGHAALVRGALAFRPCHADARASRNPRRHGDFPAARPGARGLGGAGQGGVRSARDPVAEFHDAGQLMQTRFTTEQLNDPAIRDSERNLRACVHCGFCLATCPTYTLLGDELDSPRGRIYLIKDMLEHDRPATAEVALHVDRCLSCLACQTTCPSGVNYQHLIDHARAHVEETYNRPVLDRMLRDVLARLLPYPDRFRLVHARAALARPFAGLFTGRLAADAGFGARAPACNGCRRGP